MRRLARSTLGAAALPVALALVVSAAVLDGPTSASGEAPGVLVYTNNVENLMTENEKCQGDWDELVHYMAERDTPGIVLLQQVRSQRQVDAFAGKLTELSDGRFEGLVADVEAGGGGKCGTEKSKQLNAIIWNTETLTYKDGSRDVWQSVRENPEPTGAQCVKNDQSRTVNVKASFTHHSGRRITAASVHWPTHASGNALCADNNARLLASELEQKSYRESALQIVGGDMNYGDINRNLKWCKWYRELHVNNHFTDPARSACGSDDDCIAKLWTHIRYMDGSGKKRRIDYLFARRGISAPAEYRDHGVVGFDAADKAEQRHHDENESGCRTYPDRSGCHYSEHRAVMARVF